MRRFDQKPAQWRGLADVVGKGVFAIGADKAVGVVLGGQKQKLDAAHVGGKGQGAIQRLAGGAAAGGIAVKAEDHRIGEPEQLLHMFVGAGRAERGHRVGEAQLGQRHHVHIALGDQRIAVLTQGAAGFKQAVELTPLAKHRGFRRVEVLGLFIAQHPPAKADAFALDIANRKHHAVAEPVVALFFAPVFGLVQDHQAALDKQGVVVLREDAGQAAPAFRRIAQAELLGNLARQTAAFEILNGALRLLESALVSLAGFFQHAGEGVLLLALRLGAGFVLGAAFFLGDDHAILAGEVFDGLDEGHAGVVHQEADGIAVFAAAEAVVELFGGAHRERGRLFPVKRAQAHEVGAALFELHIAAHDLHHIGARDEFLDEALGDGHRAIVGSLRRSPEQPGCASARYLLSNKELLAQVLRGLEADLMPE